MKHKYFCKTKYTLCQILYHIFMFLSKERMLNNKHKNGVNQKSLGNRDKTLGKLQITKSKSLTSTIEPIACKSIFANTSVGTLSVSTSSIVMANIIILTVLDI